jgi:hypothetical protein
MQCIALVLGLGPPSLFLLLPVNVWCVGFDASGQVVEGAFPAFQAHWWTSHELVWIAHSTRPHTTEAVCCASKRGEQLLMCTVEHKSGLDTRKAVGTAQLQVKDVSLQLQRGRGAPLLPLAQHPPGGAGSAVRRTDLSGGCVCCVRRWWPSAMAQQWRCSRHGRAGGTGPTVEAPDVSRSHEPHIAHAVQRCRMQAARCAADE